MSLERAPFPKVIRSRSLRAPSLPSLERAPFPKVIRYVRTEKPLQQGLFCFQTSKKKADSASDRHLRFIFSKQSTSAHRASCKKRAVFGTAIYELFSTIELNPGHQATQKDPPKCYS